MPETRTVHLRVAEQQRKGGHTPACATIGVTPQATDTLTDDAKHVTCPACQLIAIEKTGLAAQLYGKPS